jgi:dihydroflavonol-4-reductase
MYATHVEGTRLLCDAAAQAGVRSIVLASSSGTVAVSKESNIIHDEAGAPPLEIITRWGYYASKFYQERTALERFTGDDRRLVIVNPSLLLGPGDDRLSSTKVVLDFLARRHLVTPSGGLNFVDVRDAAHAFHEAMKRGRHGERYLLGAVNWTFPKFFGRLERISKVAAPRLALPSKVNIFGARGLNALYKGWKWTPPVEPEEIEQAEHFWYFTSAKAERELSFAARDPQETLQDTVTYLRRNFIGNEAFAS